MSASGGGWGEQHAAQGWRQLAKVRTVGPNGQIGISHARSPTWRTMSITERGSPGGPSLTSLVTYGMTVDEPVGTLWPRSP